MSVNGKQRECDNCGKMVSKKKSIAIEESENEDLHRVLSMCLPCIKLTECSFCYEPIDIEEWIAEKKTTVSCHPVITKYIINGEVRLVCKDCAIETYPCSSCGNWLYASACECGYDSNGSDESLEGFSAS